MSWQEICAHDETQALYFAPGAKARRRCDRHGGLTCRNNHAMPAQRVLVPDFQKRVTLPF